MTDIPTVLRTRLKKFTLGLKSVLRVTRMRTHQILKEVQGKVRQKCVYIEREPYLSLQAQKSVMKKREQLLEEFTAYSQSGLRSLRLTDDNKREK